MPRRPKQARAAERRESLLDAAAALLERDGFTGVTTVAIARQAKAAVGTVYDYFPNKEAVLEALLERYRQRLQAALLPPLQAAAGAPTEELIELGIRAFWRFYRDEPGYAELWLGTQMIAPLREAGQAWGDEFAALLGGLIRAHTETTAERAEIVALSLVHAVTAVVSLALTQPSREAALVDEAVRLAQVYLKSVD